MIRPEPTDLTDTKAAARHRISKALGHIQEAQNQLDKACQEISAVCFAIPLGNLAWKERMRVHDMWHKINLALEKDERAKNPRYDLDELHKNKLGVYRMGDGS